MVDHRNCPGSAGSLERGPPGVVRQKNHSAPTTQPALHSLCELYETCHWMKKAQGTKYSQQIFPTIGVMNCISPCQDPVHHPSNAERFRSTRNTPMLLTTQRFRPTPRVSTESAGAPSTRLRQGGPAPGGALLNSCILCAYFLYDWVSSFDCVFALHL